MPNESAPGARGSRVEEVDAALHRLHGSPGWIAHLQWTGLQRSYQVFRLNTQELLAVLRAAEDMADGTAALFKDRSAYFTVLDQRLHNLLASAVSLVDHTRRILRKYGNTEFLQNFQQRNDAVRSSGEASFLRCLRNYLLHYGVLNFVHQVSFDAAKSPEAKSHIEIRTADLLEWDRWDRASKLYFASCGVSVRLLGAVEVYTARMSALYTWFFDQFVSLHGADIDDANGLVREYNLVLSGGRFDHSPR